METIVSVEGLRKTYGATVAVDGISFDVQAGEIFGMVGPNGAGKTTTIECLEGLRKPDDGRLTVLGVDPQEAGQALCLRVGMQLQQSNLPERMKVWEALDTYSAFYPQAADWNRLLVELGLEEKRNTPFGKLSGGQKQRLFVALALLPAPSGSLRGPELVFLDELTTGLDPQARRAIWDLVSNIRTRGTTVILSSHFMEEAERLCDRVAILDHGRIAALDTPAALIRSLGGEERVVFSVDHPLPAGFAQAFSAAVRIEVQGERVVIHSDPKGFQKPLGSMPLVSEVVGLLTARGIPFRDLRTEQPSLEDVFLSLTGAEKKM